MNKPTWMNKLICIYTQREMIYNIKWLITFYKLWFKIQLNTSVDTWSPKTESCQNANLAVPGAPGLSPTMMAPYELSVLSEEKFTQLTGTSSNIYVQNFASSIT